MRLRPGGGGTGDSETELQYDGLMKRGSTMRSRRQIKGRAVHQDNVKAATTRLQDILRTCERLKVNPEDLSALPPNRGYEVASVGWILAVLSVALLVGGVVVATHLAATCANNNTQVRRLLTF